MMRPFTCLSLVAALGAGLFLYQEKHRAQMLDRDITKTVKLADQGRDRIGLLKAEWALLNEPERLQTLASDHLQLQSLAPSQFARLDDLPSRLPPVSATPLTPAPAASVPMAQVEQPLAPPARAPVAAPPVMAQASTAQPLAVQTSMPPAAPRAPSVKLAEAAPESPMDRGLDKPMAKPAAPLQLAAARPAPARPDAKTPDTKAMEAKAMEAKATEPKIDAKLDARLDARLAPQRAVAAAKPREDEPRPARRLYAPVMPAYSPAPVAIHAPSVQTASAMAPVPFEGSALGMAHSYLAAPVPVDPRGYATGR